MIAKMAIDSAGIAIQRCAPFICYKHVLIFAGLVGIVLTSILLAGCSSYSSMTNIYILGLSYTNSTLSDLSPIEKNLSNVLNDLKGAAQLEVRTGYFGMCVRQHGILWFCSSNAHGLAQQIGPENDPLNLIATASRFKDDVLFSGLFFMAIILVLFSCLLVATFPGWHSEHNESTGSDIDVAPFPSRPVSQIATSSAVVAAMLCLVASLWQHVGSVGAAAMAETANYGNVKSDIGAGAVVLGWVGVVFMAIIAIGLAILVSSLLILDRLTDD
ncbi:hypothetical protein P280DRAFT_437750 [Massarina eburnea CBS 473.64]|uniref:Membrane fusion mating protein FIG1 n=1 Tax=Massarina eburnea CBS 473.64 TaxID=1395130 RepID=A0A6A6RLU3_9PLEO|nr:hypothetical protein P280DRAFT_437750 [Massarina eburnea CBS 473.64]